MKGCRRSLQGLTLGSSSAIVTLVLLFFGTFLAKVVILSYRESSHTETSEKKEVQLKRHDPTAPYDRIWRESGREGPKSVTWLMSFPNSGTSYTMDNTMFISQLSTATNYATEMGRQGLLNKTTDLQPIRKAFRNDWEGGPWQFNITLPVPEYRILCKTHCGGYFDLGTAQESVLSLAAFEEGCTETSQKRDKSLPTAHHNKLRLHYELDGLVDSAIHLIRDPFDNMISRMHLGLRSRIRFGGNNRTRNETEDLMRTKEGVEEWCNLVDQNFWNLEDVSVLKDRSTMARLISKETLALLPYDPIPFLDIPCHGEFFRYAQWHNHTVNLIQQHNLSVLTIHYENYATAYNETVMQIMDFLGQEWIHPPKPFESGLTYRDVFFSQDEQKAVRAMMKHMVNPDTWKVLKDYFRSF